MSKIVCSCKRSFVSRRSFQNHYRWCSGEVKRKERNVKICSVCGLSKTLDQFWRRKKRGTSGEYDTLGRCKVCEASYLREYRRKYPEKLRKWNKDNNEKYRSKILKEACEICGERRVLEIAHIKPRNGKPMHKRNADYNHPSNILTLCPTHHSLLDKDLLSPTEKVFIQL